jgi:hypothetical protein
MCISKQWQLCCILFVNTSIDDFYMLRKISFSDESIQNPKFFSIACLLGPCNTASKKIPTNDNTNQTNHCPTGASYILIRPSSLKVKSL